ncbi:MAG: hypothetical protein QOE86_3433 [Solirubrobacteraceae bacterium]|nr:hypothetical protein [Solirubrobacteraceae bacterium]
MFRRVLALHPPVDAPIARPFAYAGSPFARGLHRGIDVAAPPGTPVEAPCAGVVAYAGPHALTLRCGRYRVTLLPVRAVRARQGDAVVAGARVAQVGATASHPGLHLGVRAASDAFGYVDPAPLLAHSPSMPLGPAPAPRTPRLPARPDPRPVPPAPEAPPAPVTAWAALVVAALAATGTTRLRLRLRLRRGRRRAPTRAAGEA